MMEYFSNPGSDSKSEKSIGNESLEFGTGKVDEDTEPGGSGGSGCSSGGEGGSFLDRGD